MKQLPVRRKIAAAALGLMVLFLALGSLVRIPTLVIKYQRTDQIVFAAPMFFKANFFISFIHSVQKTPVREYYTLAPENGFILTSTEYSSYGAGLPYLETDGYYEIHNGKFVITGLNRPVPEINLIYFDFIEYDLHYAGRIIRFADYFAPSGELVTIARENQTLGKFIFYSVFN